MRKPEFTFQVELAGFWAGKGAAQWSDVSRDVIVALRRSCEHYGLAACVLLDRRGILRGIDSVTVRLRGKGSLWTATDIAKVHASTTKCIVIDGTGSRTALPDAFPALVDRLRHARWRVSDLR